MSRDNKPESPNGEKINRVRQKYEAEAIIDSIRETIREQLNIEQATHEVVRQGVTLNSSDAGVLLDALDAVRGSEETKTDSGFSGKNLSFETAIGLTASGSPKIDPSKRNSENLRVCKAIYQIYNKNKQQDSEFTIKMARKLAARQGIGKARALKAAWEWAGGLKAVSRLYKLTTFADLKPYSEGRIRDKQACKLCGADSGSSNICSKCVKELWEKGTLMEHLKVQKYSDPIE